MRHLRRAAHRKFSCAAWMLAALLLGAACGGDSEAPVEPPAEPEVSASGELGAGDTEGEFESARALVDEMASAGLECADFKRLEATQESLADFGLCFLEGDRTHETDIYITTNPDHVQGWADSFAQYDSIYVLTGGNWLITNGSVEELEQISAAIGGTLVTK